MILNGTDETAIALPKMFPVQQQFHAPTVNDIESAIISELSKPNIRHKIKANDRVAIGVGSRGIANLSLIVKCVIQQLLGWGAKPFIVPAMGSHGGGTPHGQLKVLSQLGITEETMGVPIVSGMDTVQIGSLPCGMPVYLDREAAASNAIIVINRIKPHTSFTGEYESGLLKMMAIGLGRHRGALTVHQRPFQHMPELIPALSNVYLSKSPIAFGLAILENAYDETADILAIPAEEMIGKEKELLVLAKNYLPRLLIPAIDLLIIREIGKNISGTGMDSNIVGRSASSAFRSSNAPPIERIVVLGLTPETEGNACGIGLADMITSRVYEQINLEYTYANVITSKNLGNAKIPLILQDERTAIQLALKTCYEADAEHPRIVFIENTLKLKHIWVSEALLPAVEESVSMQIQGAGKAFSFDQEGYLADGFWPDE